MPSHDVKRVLVVDDHPAVCTLVRVALEASGRYRIAAETDSAAGAQAALGANPDVVLVDLSVGGALDLISTIKESAPSAVVVVYSAWPAPVGAPPALEAGADAYIDKRQVSQLVDDLASVLDAGRAVPSPEVDAVAAVTAHGLLNSLAVVGGAAATLRVAWDNLAGPERSGLLEGMCTQAETLIDGLAALPPVVVHRCLHELAAPYEACHRLDGGAEAIDGSDRDSLLITIEYGCAAAANLLRDVVRGLPDEVLQALDELNGQRGGR